MKVRLHGEADAEVEAAAKWYENRLAGLGERFLLELVDALIDVEKHPARFSRVAYRTQREIRRRMFEHFPYSIVYEVRETECVVLAVSHAARRPGYWKTRVGQE